MRHNEKTKSQRKAQEGHLEEKNHNASKWHKKWQAKEKGKKELRKAPKHKNSQNSI
jgi:hypothetical protein